MEVELLADAFIRWGGKEKLNLVAIYTSALKRHKLTAEIITAKLNLPVYYEEGLMKLKQPVTERKITKTF